MRNEVVVSKMLTYIDKIQRYSNGMTYDTFVENDLVLEACVFNLSQLGELANKVDQEYKKKHSEIPWSQVYGLRNRIVHDYEGVNLQLVWEIISDDLPELKESLQVIKEQK
ncbi:MAG: DUF86 domain-containing protein [Clostridiales bacterium]|nr:DUF86 domain-containing protein [Clostridiales bacterium]MCD7954829.1 DUF86 domain-containing protein [Lachnospiraceae bacterium]